MTRLIRTWFRPLVIVLAAGTAVLALAGAASASTTAASDRHHLRCDETLVYRDSGAYDPRGELVVVRDVCNVRIREYGEGYGRHNEVVTYDQLRRHHLEFHIVFGVSDAEVFD